MALSDTSKVSYFNTLIYTIVSGIISLVLLMLLFFDFGKKYIYFIITVEVGIFTVIAICLYQIIYNEYVLNNMRSKLPERVSFLECPDYFVKQDIDNIIMCKNYYSVRKNNQEYMMKIYPIDESLPSSFKLDERGSGIRDAFNLYQLEQNNKLLKSAREQCGVVYEEPKASELEELRGYSKLPWTHAVGRCGAYVDV